MSIDSSPCLTPTSAGQRLVLASTSIYRRELLFRLGMPFEVAAPDVDETPLAGEAPDATALRLSAEKARAVARQFPDALIIGSDQVAYLGGKVYGKPLRHENAVRQLQEMSGQTVTFCTGLALFNSRTGALSVRRVDTRVTFRTLTSDLIERYLRREEPYNCAGSAKSEGLGIALIARIEGDDPNALIGLPLIALCDLLAGEGVSAI